MTKENSTLISVIKFAFLRWIKEIDHFWYFNVFGWRKLQNRTESALCSRNYFTLNKHL